MTISCDELRQLAQGFSLVRECDILRDGSLRFATPFQYPDGSFVDLFLSDEGDLFQSVLLTDLGQTTTYLLDFQIRPWDAKKRKQALSDICETLGVEQQGGRLQVRLSKDGLPDLSQAIVRLAQACVRVADLGIITEFEE